MQNTQNTADGQLNKDYFYRRIRLAGGASSRSMALTLPKKFLDDMNISSGDHVAIYKKDTKIIIQKA